MAWLLCVLMAVPSYAQFGGNFGRIKGAIEQGAKKNEIEKEKKEAEKKAEEEAVKGQGVVYYVSAAGSARAEGKSPDKAKKDLQAVLNLIRDNGENGAIVRIAEGNYLGYMNSGYVEIYNFVTLEGGWNASFTERNPLKYITKMEPTQEQLGSNGSKGVIHTNRALDDVMAKKPKGTLVIDGIFINLGFENVYKPADPSDPKFGCPSKAFETGRIEDAIPPQVEHQISISRSSSAAAAARWRYAITCSSPTATAPAVSTEATRTARRATSISTTTRLLSRGAATKRWRIWATATSA